MNAAPASATNRRALRVCWPATMPDPTPGAWLLSESGRSAYRIVRVEVIHRAPASPKPRLVLHAEAHPAIAIPVNAQFYRWALTLPATTPAVAAETDAAAPPGPARTADEVAATVRKANTAAAVEQVNRVASSNADDGLIPAVRRMSDHAGRVDRGDWSDPAAEVADLHKGRQVSGAGTASYQRAANTVAGYRRYCQLRKLHKSGKSAITQDHITAAELLRVAYEVSRLGWSAGGGFSEKTGSTGSTGPRADHGAAAESAQSYAREFRRAVSHLPATPPDLLQLVRWVVLDHRDLVTWVRSQPTALRHERDEMRVAEGRLTVALDMLVDHYRSEIDTLRMAGQEPA